jgi:hypothetical protein
LDLGDFFESIARKSGRVREQFTTGGRISW